MDKILSEDQAEVRAAMMQMYALYHDQFGHYPPSGLMREAVVDGIHEALENEQPNPRWKEMAEGRERLEKLGRKTRGH